MGCTCVCTLTPCCTRRQPAPCSLPPAACPLLHQTAACPTVARMAGVIERLRRHSEGEDFTAYLRAVGLMRGGGGIGGGKCRSGEVASAVEWPPHRYLLGLEAARAQCAVRMTKNPVRMERITPASRSQ